MAAANNRIQSLMDEVYTEWQKEENRGRDKWDILNEFTEAHQIAVLFGNFNYQVENGGIDQWIYNGYFHDDAGKFAGYLEAGAASDDRCEVILDRVNLLDQYARETGCDRHGNYRNPEDWDGEEGFIGEMIDSNAFDSWYYSHCGKDGWWETVCGIIDKAEGREVSPATRDESDGEAAAPPLEVYIENADNGYIGGFTIPFPTTADTLRPFLEGSEIGGWRDISIVDAFGEFAGKGDAVTEACRESMSPDTLNELNYLAALISGMNEEGRNAFSAAMQAGWHCENVAGLINLAQNRDAFVLQPVYNAGQYGEFLMDMYKDETSGAFARLEKSEDPDERDLAKHIQRLEAAVDFTAYGRNYAAEEEGKFTEAGYILQAGEFRETYRGPEDIPAEYRIYDGQAQPEAYIAAGPVRVENLLVTPFVMQAYALADGLSGVAQGVRALAGGNRDFFLRLDEGKISLHSAQDVYHESSDAYGLWTEEPAPGVRAFALSFYQPGGGVGGIYEIDPAITRENILQYAEAGPDRLRVHLAEQHELYPEVGSEVSLSAFFTDLNRDFMNRSEYARWDMLRIPHEAAKELLAGGAQVYRLTPRGPRQMSAMEAVNGKVWSHRDAAVAILPSDLDRLNKWAERAAGDILRANDRGEKSKTRGPEL